MSTTRRLIAAAFAVTLTMSFAAACSEETKDSARETADNLEEDAKTNASELGDELDATADEGLARAAAEELRARIKANGTASTQGARSMAAIGESSVDIAGDPEVAGVTDADGDGMDDDGKVQVNVGTGSACVTLPATGTDTTVEGGAC